MNRASTVLIATFVTSVLTLTGCGGGGGGGDEPTVRNTPPDTQTPSDTGDTPPDSSGAQVATWDNAVWDDPAQTWQ